MEHGKPTPQDYSTQVPHSHLHCNLTTVRQEGRKRSSTKPTDRKRLYVHTYTHTHTHKDSRNTKTRTQTCAQVHGSHTRVNIH